MQKISLFQQLIFEIQSILESRDPFLTMPIQNFFDQLLIFGNLYQHAKKQFILSVYSSDTVKFRVPSRDWPHAFLTMPTQKFSITLSFV